jgi:hypothetical protein
LPKKTLKTVQTDVMPLHFSKCQNQTISNQPSPPLVEFDPCLQRKREDND